MVNYKKSEIELAETGYFSGLMLDYVSGKEAVTSLYSYKPTLEAFAQAIQDKSKENINRNILADVLQEQYAAVPDCELQKACITLLRKNTTYTVCTGHQLCLFTGPLYFVYKILTTINLAEVLKKRYPEYDFVPMYWMAGEDHDFDEVRSVNLFGKKLSWEHPNAKGAVGSLSTDSIASVLEEFKQIAGDTDNAKELVQLFSDAYLRHNTLAEATRYLVHQLFAKYGLVVIDGNDVRLKREFIGIVEDDIFNNSNYKSVAQTIAEIEQTVGKAQVNPRAINCFYIQENLRERIEFADGMYNVLNTDIAFTADELRKELQLHPERFSPNVVLRPLYQQKILPNLAYIGGPGELAYWLEYKRMFDFHKINFPVLIPRNFAMLIDSKSVQQLQKLGLGIVDLFKETDVLVKEFINKNAGSAVSLKEQEQELTSVYGAVSTKAVAVDATLKGSVEAELQKALNSLKAIEAKLVRAEKQKQETSLNQIKKLKERFFPNNSLQERYDTLTPHYLKSGKGLIGALKRAFEPLEYKMVVLHLTPTLSEGEGAI